MEGLFHGFMVNRLSRHSTWVTLPSLGYLVFLETRDSIVLVGDRCPFVSFSFQETLGAELGV
jgi:hypothetical protein